MMPAPRNELRRVKSTEKGAWNSLRVSAAVFVFLLFVLFFSFSSFPSLLSYA